MNLQEYKKLCKICNRIILRNFKYNPNIIAINILSIVKEHPVFYQELQKKIKRNNFLLFYEIVKNFLKLFVTSLLSFIFFFKIKIIKINKNKKIFFLSHSYNANKEFYFSPLIKNLSKKNYTIINIKHKNKYSKYLYSNFGNFTILNFSQKKNLLIKTLNLFLFLYKKFLFEKKLNKFFLIAASEAISLSTLNNIKIAHEIESIIDECDIESFVCLFEGLAYERYLIYLLNKKKINIIGFQHTGLSKYQNSLLNLTNPEFYPNKILLKSKREFLNIKKKISPDNLVILPSRFKERALKIKLKKFNKKKINVLFLMDGELSELNMAIKTCNILNNNNSLNLTLRLHPSLKFDLKNQNFKISQNTLKKDIYNNHIVLFRNSTAVITAIENGLYPIFVNYGNLISNPLQYLNIEEIYLKKGNIQKQLLKIINNINVKKYKKLYLEVYKQSLKNKIIKKNMIIN